MRRLPGLFPEIHPLSPKKSAAIAFWPLITGMIKAVIDLNVCNSCQKLRSCAHDFYFYRTKYADDAYEKRKHSCRSGINQSPESLEKLYKLISPLLKQRQPLSHIYLTHKEEINCSQRTLYNYIDLRYFSAINLDLPRKVSYKPRKKRMGEKEIPGYHMERTYLDFEQYIAAHPDCSIVEMDVVEGTDPP